jgi:AcrR family transcriptional regulator
MSGPASVAGVEGSARRSYRGLTPQQRDAERRERVIDAAMRLCAVQRVTDLPVRLVCQTAKVTTRQFYEVFGERGEMFASVYAHAAEVALRHTVDALGPASDPVDTRVRSMVQRLFHAEPSSELGEAMAVLFALGATDQEIRTRRAVALYEASETLATELGVATADAEVLVAAITQLLEMEFLGASRTDPDRTVEALLSMFAARSATSAVSATPGEPQPAPRRRPRSRAASSPS